MPNLLHDLRFALRSFSRTPGFTLVVIATLALGIGANTALWSVVDRVLLRPLPFPEPERLVAVWEDHTLRKVEREWLSPANFYDFQAGCRSCERMAAFTPVSFNLTGGGEPERVTGMRVSAEMFPCSASSRRSAARSCPRTTAPARGRSPCCRTRSGAAVSAPTGESSAARSRSTASRWWWSACCGPASSSPRQGWTSGRRSP